MLQRLLLSCFVGLALLLQRTEGKFVNGHLRSRLAIEKQIGGWWYWDRFAFDIGRGSVEINLYTTNHDVNEVTEHSEILFYLDENWDAALAAKTCQQRYDLARIKKKVSYFEKTDINGQKLLTTTQHIHQSIRPHYWYIVWSQCGTENHVPADVHGDIHYEIVFKQENGSHTSVEDKGMLQAYGAALAFLSFGAMAYYRNKKDASSFNKDKGQRIYTATALLGSSIAAQYMAILAEVFHLLIYALNGSGFVWIEFYGEVMDTASHVALSVVFLILSWGPRGFSIGKLLITIIVLMLGHFVCSAMHKVADVNDPRDMYHDHDSHSRVFLLFMRVAVYMWCGNGIYKQYEQCGPQPSEKKTFYFQLLVLVSIWFLCLPLFVIIATVFLADYWQHTLVTCGNIIVQSVVLGVFAWKSMDETIYSTLISAPLQALGVPSVINTPQVFQRQAALTFGAPNTNNTYNPGSYNPNSTSLPGNPVYQQQPQQQYNPAPSQHFGGASSTAGTGTASGMRARGAASPGYGGGVENYDNPYYEEMSYNQNSSGGGVGGMGSNLPPLADSGRKKD